MYNTELTEKLFSAIDSKNTDLFCSFLTDDCIFTLGNFPPAVGKDAIRTSVQQFFDSISALSHTNLKTYTDGDYIFVRGDVTYTRHDGSQLEVEYLNHFRMQDGKIADYRVFADISQLYK